MRSKHITRFGHPLSTSGALYGVFDQEGLVQMDIDIKLAQLQAKGIMITRNIRAQVKDEVKQKRVEYHSKVSQLGIPEQILRLFQITKKAQAEKYSRELVLCEYDLFLLIHNCNQINLTHRSKFKQFIPEHLQVTYNDRHELKTGNPKSFIKKMSPGLLERRYIHVHLFEYSSDWHCFYFSHQDIDPLDNTPHWKYGRHLHYISYIWSNLSKRQVWYKFNKRFTEISDSFHIRFEPFEFPNLDEAANSDLKNEDELPPCAVCFNPKYTNGYGSVPTPVAHLATRGAWFGKAHISHKYHQ